MANIPDIKQIAAKHYDVYEAYYRSLDPKNTNQIGALDAAKFLKKSGLSDVILSRVWDLSDPKGNGFLDKQGLFVSLKLVSLAQAGEKIDVKNMLLETNAPRCGDVPKMKPPPVPKMTNVPPPMQSATDWTVKPDEKAKYLQLFASLQPEKGVLPGNKVRGVLMNSKLPVETLGSIWDLADQDRDGSLDEHEFIVAMHLVYKALDSRAIPSSLPKELQKPPPKAADDFGGDFVANFPADIVPIAPIIPPSRPAPPVAAVPAVPLIPAIQSASKLGGNDDWVLTTIEKLKYQEVFERSDLDKDGLVSGMEIKDVFLKSGLPQNLLAHIWALCDTHQTGKLNSEQFALAMWLIDRKKKGMDPPTALAPEMIPPSMRPNATAAPPQPQKPIFTNPELEMISKEIEELTKERHAIEAEVAQKEADIRIKSGEMRSLQSELDTLTATLKQLETQRGEAQKRLDDLKAQQNEIDESIISVTEELKQTSGQVTKLKEQCQKQEETIKEQETELDSRKMELQKLKDEEHALEQEYDKSLKEKEKISVHLQETQLQISQVHAMVSQLEEIQRQMKDALALCKVAIEENNAVIVSDYSLSIEPEFRDFKKALLSPEEKAKDAFNDEAFNDPFKPANPTSSASAGGFEDSFDNRPSAFGDEDSFGNKWNNDPFTSANNDPFAGSASEMSAKDTGKDDFGSDPFAVLHAPPKGSNPSPVHAPESPSPALPPKKAKQPPPRPAPPRPAMPPAPTKPTDGFGTSFANFDDFDMKASTVAENEIPNTQIVVENNKEENVSTVTTAAPAADFQEDPFKNYRYEDPFMISVDFQEDPFKDENANEKANEKDKFDDFFEKDTFGQNATSFDKHDDFESTGFDDKKNNNVKNNNGFDAFGLTKNDLKDSQSKSTFGFDADFANFEEFNNNGKSNNGGSVSTDAWGDTKSNVSYTTKVKKYKETDIKVSKISRYNADYSDNYEQDLEQVIKRSMVDQ